MNYPLYLGLISILTLALSATFTVVGIRQAKKHGWLDIPSARRRHPNPIPVVGGVGILLAWFVGVALSGAHWASPVVSHLNSLWTMGGCVIALSCLGLGDDLKGFGAWPKLLVEIAVGAVVLAFLPEVHGAVRELQALFGPTAGWLAWPAALLWIVGITNGINLIDGLDGLAGGASATIAATLAAVAILYSGQGSWLGGGGLLLAAAISGFLIFNWNPAKIFLGDNGSLPIGFIIGTISLSLLKVPHVTTGIISTGLMLAYPILDMGTCTLRRIQKGRPIFKADRNHLHFRVQRLGLSTRQTAIFLLSLGVVFQFAALSARAESLGAGIVLLVSVGFALFSVLYLIRASERAKIREMLKRASRTLARASEGSDAVKKRRCPVAHISLEPLLESGLQEERERLFGLMSSLKLLVSSGINPDDRIMVSDDEISVLFLSHNPSAHSVAALRELLHRRLALFQEMFGVQYSLSALPIEVEIEDLYCVNSTEQTSYVRSASPLIREVTAQ